MLTDLRKLLWLYLLLLLFEGALRKWIVPQFGTPLLLVRDPLVIWIYIQALRHGLRFNNSFFIANAFLAVATTAISFMVSQAGSLAPAVTLYGFRTDFLQIPLIFLIPQILHRDDVIQMGKWCLYIAVPMAFLAVLQFKSPPDSFWNKGAMWTQYGTVRTSGTFSFGTGLGAFYALSSVFLMYGYINTRTYKIWLLGLVTLATLLEAACSGSRGGLVAIGLVVAAAVLCVITRGKGGMGLLIGGVVVAIAVSVVSSTSVGEEGIGQLNQRIVDAGQAENGGSGFIMRYLNTITAPFSEIDQVPFFGFGLGLGTNAGLGMYDGHSLLLWPEQEWDRLFFECGPLFGFFLCLFRVALTVTVAMRAFRAYRQDNFLPALLFAACAVGIFNGQWGVPTTLGFAIFVAGLTLAACEDPDDWEHDYDEDHDHDHEHVDGDDEHHDADGESDHPHPADRIR
jgi:hypothetical protein